MHFAIRFRNYFISYPKKIKLPFWLFVTKNGIIYKIRRQKPSIEVLFLLSSSVDITIKNKPPSFKVLEGWGCGGRKASFKKFPFPTKKHKIPLSRFFFGTRGAKKKLGKKKAP